MLTIEIPKSNRRKSEEDALASFILSEILQRRVMEEAEWKILPRAIDEIANGKILLGKEQEL